MRKLWGSHRRTLTVSDVNHCGCWGLKPRNFEDAQQGWKTGGRYKDRTCAPLAGRRLSKPVHYHSANLPGCAYRLRVPAPPYLCGRLSPSTQGHAVEACLVAVHELEGRAHAPCVPSAQQFRRCSFHACTRRVTSALVFETSRESEHISNGAQDPIRTDDLMLTRHLLYQLSYLGKTLRRTDTGA